jgi:putative ABC transport system permease protein
MLDGLQEILFTLKQNKLRTVLTAFGVFWGIFMLVLLLGAGRGMQNGIYDDFGSDVRDWFIVWSGDTSVAFHGMGPGRKIRFNYADVDAIRNQVNGVRIVAGTTGLGNGTITFADRNSNADVVGIPDEYFRLKEDIPFGLGRKLDPMDQADIRKIVVIGTSVAERLFVNGVDPVGKDVKVKGVVMKVAGVFHDKMNNGRASERVYMPQTTVSKVFGSSDRVDNIWIRPQPGVVEPSCARDG